jgi:MFS family permease
VFAYERGGAVAVGVVGLIRMLPAAAVAPFAAYLGDRFRRERFLVVVSAVGAVALAASALAVALDANAAVVYALAAVVGVATTLFRPALQALLPSLARTPEELVASNGASATIESLGTLVGPLAAGVLVAVTGASTVFGVAAGAYVVAAFLLARVVVEGRLRAPASRERVVREALGGFALLARDGDTRLIVGLMVAQTFVRGALNVLIVVTSFRLLDAGDGAVGYLTAAIGAGGLFGAAAAVPLAGRRLALPFGLALVFWGLPIAFIAPFPYVGTAILLLAVVGAANSVVDVAGFTLLQRIVPDEVLMRLLGAVWGAAMGGLAVGSIVASALVAGLGVKASLVIVGAILPVLALASLGRLRSIDRTAAAPLRELAFVEDVPMFAQLPVVAKEHVAANLVRIDAPAGTRILRQGDAGDRFYIVADGAVEVIKDGQRVVMRGPTEYFGEIALLRGVPRTADVTALTDVELYALERDDFLAAVTGHAAGREAGEAVVGRRLAALSS